MGRREAEGHFGTGEEGIWKAGQFSAGADFRCYRKGLDGQILDNTTQGDQLSSESVGWPGKRFALHLCRSLVQSSVLQSRAAWGGCGRGPQGEEKPELTKAHTAQQVLS